LSPTQLAAPAALAHKPAPAALAKQQVPAKHPFAGAPVESLVARTLRDPEIPVRLGASWVALLRSMTAMDPAARPTAAAAHAKAQRLLPRR
jgi:hypothetical protein